MSSSVWMGDVSTTTVTTNQDNSFWNCTSCCGLKLPKIKADDNNVQAHRDSIGGSSTTSKKLPFYGILPEPLREGRAIYVDGNVSQNCTRFSINLVCGKDLPSVDIGFHFNPRLDQRYVVRNCRINGLWGEEETTACDKFNFRPEQTFQICIFVGSGEFLVAVNEKHFCAFGFRIPLDRITAIDARGSIGISKVEFKNLTSYPAPTDNNKPIRIENEEEPKNDHDLLEMPLVGNLPDGFKVGDKLVVEGRVKLLPHSFYVNLQNGAQFWPHPIIPLHVNPRFSTTLGEYALIRNAWNDGAWGAEERLPGYHFQPGLKFTLTIQKEMFQYTLWVNGKMSGEFPFRSGDDGVDTVYIQGGVFIRTVFVVKNKLIDNNSKSSILTHTLKIIDDDYVDAK